MSNTDRLLIRPSFKLQPESFFGRKHTSDQSFTYNKHNLPSFKQTRIVSNIRQKFLDMNKQILSTSKEPYNNINLISTTNNINKSNNNPKSILNIPRPTDPSRNLNKTNSRPLLPKLCFSADFKKQEVNNMYIIQKDLNKKNKHKKFLKSKLQYLLKNSIVLDEETVEVMVKIL
jgi:hypothetical protein